MRRRRSARHLPEHGLRKIQPGDVVGGQDIPEPIGSARQIGTRLVGYRRGVIVQDQADGAGRIAAIQIFEQRNELYASVTRLDPSRDVCVMEFQTRQNGPGSMMNILMIMIAGHVGYLPATRWQVQDGIGALSIHLSALLRAVREVQRIQILVGIKPAREISLTVSRYPPWRPVSAALPGSRADRKGIDLEPTHARPANSRFSVDTFTLSPSLMKSGTRISRPVSSLADLVPLPLEESPRTPGSV
jgi:hypothetical protein